jgi:hypothetical protein
METSSKEKFANVEVTPPSINAPLVKNIILGSNAKTVAELGFREFGDAWNNERIASARLVEITVEEMRRVTDTVILLELDDGEDDKTGIKFPRIMVMEYESRERDSDESKRLSHIRGIVPMFQKQAGVPPEIRFCVIYGPDVKPFAPKSNPSEEFEIALKLVFLSQSPKMEDQFANLDEKLKIGGKATAKETADLVFVLDNTIFYKDSYFKILRYLADDGLFPDRARAFNITRALDSKYRHLAKTKKEKPAARLITEFMPSIFDDVTLEGMKTGIELGLAVREKRMIPEFTAKQTRMQAPTEMIKTVLRELTESICEYHELIDLFDKIKNNKKIQ